MKKTTMYTADAAGATAATSAKKAAASAEAAAARQAAPAKKTAAAKKTIVARNTAAARPQPGAKATTGRARTPSPANASQMIDARIAGFADWRGETLARLREIIRRADPAVVEEWKWGIPVWSHDGILCTGEVYKSAVKTTFANGAALDDPSGLFNSSLDGNTRRAIDFRAGDAIDATAFAALIRAAVALNAAKTTPARPRSPKRSAATPTKSRSR